MATVLVVDDERPVLDVAARILEHGGYEALTAISGAEALELCENRSEPIHLLLTDINMPRMNGPELAQCLVKLYPGLPVLFMTGYSRDTPQMRTLLQSGAFGKYRMLTKPFASSTLLDAVGAIVRS